MHPQPQLPKLCAQWLDVCLASLGRDLVEEDAFRGHLEICQECAAAEERFAAQVCALEGLPSLKAPEELAHCLKLALTPGGRQDRALAGIGALPRVPAPTALEGRVADELATADSAQGHWAQDVQQSGSVTAPAALDDRVDQSLRALAVERAVHRGEPGERGLSSWRWSIAGLAAAAALLVIVGGPPLGSQESSYSFTVVRGSSAGPLQAHQVSLLAAVTGRQCSQAVEGQR